MGAQSFLAKIENRPCDAFFYLELEFILYLGPCA